MVALVVTAGAVYWYGWRRRTLYSSDGEAYTTVSCDRFAGHSFCIYVGSRDKLYTYAVDGSSTLSTERYSSALEAAAYAKIFLAILGGDIKAQQQAEQEAQAQHAA